MEKKPVTVDSYTGEVIPYVGQRNMTTLDKFCSITATNGDPVQVALLDFVNASPIEKMQLLSTYTGAALIPNADAIGRIFRITGVVVCSHGAFKAMSSKDGDELSEGYNYMLLMTDSFHDQDIIVEDRDGEGKVVGKHVESDRLPIAIKTSAQQVVEFFIGMARIFGWYNWEEGQLFYFYGNQSEGFKVRLYVPKKGK